jgi:hypothetical protein
MIAGKEAEIASLKKELAEVKEEAKSSAAPAAEPTMPPDPKCQPGTHDSRLISSWRQMQREFRKPSGQEVREAIHGEYKSMRQAQFRMDSLSEITLQLVRGDLCTSQAVEGGAANEGWGGGGGGHSLDAPLYVPGEI